MNIVTTTAVFPPCYPPKEALIRLLDCGFKHLDLALDYLVQEPDFPFVTDAWEDFATELAEFSEAHGVRYTHAHADEDLASRSELMRRSFETCRVLGIPYMVVHPIFRDKNQRNIESADEFISVNVAAVQPLLEMAQRCNLTVLTENLLWGASIYPKNISDLVDAVGSPSFGWCYDTGHANAFGIKPDSLVGLKHSPLSLHIQDNRGIGKDEHLLPGDGTIDWKNFLDVLHSIDYKGDLVLEAHRQSLKAADEERDAIISELYSRAEKMKYYFSILK